MILLKPIGFKNLREHICEGFLEDVELFERYAHKNHASPDEMVDVNLRAIQEASLDYDIELYAVIAKDSDGVFKSIGFTVLMKKGVEIQLLYSYAINVAWRKKEVLLAWLAAVENKFGDNAYAVSLYAVNSRAIAFFKRNGFINEKRVDQTILLWQ